MPKQFRLDAAQAATSKILKLLAVPTPFVFDQVAYLVLEAIYECEGRLDEERQPRRMLCTGCFKTLRLVPGCEGKKCQCRRCGHLMRLPRSISLN